MIGSSGFLGQWVRRGRGEISPCCWEKLLLYTRMSFLIPKYSELCRTSGPEAVFSGTPHGKKSSDPRNWWRTHTLYCLYFLSGEISSWTFIWCFEVLVLFVFPKSNKGFQCYKKSEKWNIPLRFLSKSLCSYCHPFGENLDERVKFC